MRSHRGRGATLPRQWSPRPASKTEDRSVTWFHPLWRHVLQRPDFQIEHFPRRIPRCKDRIMTRNLMKNNRNRTTRREAKGAPGVSRVPESGWPLPLSATIRGPDGGKTPRKEVEKGVFSKSTTWVISAQLLYQHAVKPTVAFHESQAGNRHKIILSINLRRKHGSPNFCNVYGLESAKPDLQSTFKKPGDDPAAG